MVVFTNAKSQKDPECLFQLKKKLSQVTTVTTPEFGAITSNSIDYPEPIMTQISKIVSTRFFLGRPVLYIALFVLTS